MEASVTQNKAKKAAEKNCFYSLLNIKNNGSKKKPLMSMISKIV